MATMQPTHDTTNWVAVIEGCLLVGTGSMLMRKIWDGYLPLYIHPRYTTLVTATAVVLVIIGGFRLWQIGGGREVLRGRLGTYALLLAPLLLGVLIPAKPAGSALVDPQQLNTIGRSYRNASTMAIEDSTRWTLLDWMFASSILSLEAVQGKPVDVIGFVYHAPDQPSDEFFVVRYTLSCCVADRAGVSLPVQSAGAAGLPNDQWVRVQGVIDVRPNEGKGQFVITDAQIELVSQPREPYLYP